MWIKALLIHINTSLDGVEIKRRKKDFIEETIQTREQFLTVRSNESVFLPVAFDFLRIGAKSGTARACVNCSSSSSVGKLLKNKNKRNFEKCCPGQIGFYFCSLLSARYKNVD